MHPADSIDTMSHVCVGVISDTHGTLHPAVIDLFRDVDVIIHAGDVCGYGVTEGLRAIAPLHAVAGNCDSPEVNPGLPGFCLFTLANTNIALIHDLSRLVIDPAASGVRLVIHGHTHIAGMEWVDGLLYLNPGSAGSPRFGRPRSVALVNICASEIRAKIVEFTG